MQMRGDVFSINSSMNSYAKSVAQRQASRKKVRQEVANHEERFNSNPYEKMNVISRTSITSQSHMRGGVSALGTNRTYRSNKLLPFCYSNTTTHYIPTPNIDPYKPNNRLKKTQSNFTQNSQERLQFLNTQKENVIVMKKAESPNDQMILNLLSKSNCIFNKKLE